MLASVQRTEYRKAVSATETEDRTCPVDVDLAGSMTEVLAGQVRKWSQECQRFLEWQRRHVLVAESTNELRSRHEAVLRRLLALGRMLNAATSDPEFMDRRAAELVKSRVAQLQESWELSHGTMTAAEAGDLLAAHFKL